MKKSLKCVLAYVTELSVLDALQCLQTDTDDRQQLITILDMSF